MAPSTVSLESTLFFETPAEIYARVYRAFNPRATPPQFQVEFCRFASANSFIRARNGQVSVRITDALESAPAPIQEALAYILLSKLFRRSIPAEYSHRYRRYLNLKDVRGNLDQMRQERGRKLIAPAKGTVYDLDLIFDEVNFRYFFGLMPRPAIGWSRRAGRHTLGHYDASHNTIAISRLLDRTEVPRIAVEYVLFHEMLHIRYPVQHVGSRRRVHTPEFKAAEKQFEGMAEVRALLKRV